MVIEDEMMVGQRFSESKFDRFVAITSSFSRCDFSGAQMGDVCFGAGELQSTYTDCNFDRTKFDARAPGNVRFERCTFQGVNIQNLNCAMAEFVDCTFSGVIRKGYFNGRTLGVPAIERKINEFRGNDFSKTRLLDISFRTGVDLRLQQLPSGEDYIYANDAARFIAALPARDLTKKYGRQFTAIEQVLKRDLADGQQQLFMSIMGFPPKWRPMLHEIKQAGETYALAV